MEKVLFIPLSVPFLLVKMALDTGEVLFRQG